MPRWGAKRPQPFQPSECTVPVPAAPLEGTNPLKIRPNNPQSPVFTGFCKTGTPPAISNTSPVSGALVQAGRVNPSFICSTAAFGDLGTGRPGNPPFIRSTPFGDPGTGRPGYPLFYSCSFTCTRQRPASSAPAHSPCRGRAATTVSNKPSLLCCTRQLTGLPCRLSCPC